ncbi:MAG: hypothetical protein EBV15_06980 [Bacteroidetes bacterium]|nr:hypothetical protein [Bacteroidota bacterium]
MHAQGRKTRFCDFKIEIDRFNEGDTFYTPGLIHTRMYIINNGPDTVFKGDMLHIEYKFGGYYYNPSFPPCGKTLAVGDSLLFEKRFSPNGYLNVFDGIFCSFAKLAQIYNGDSLIYEDNFQLKDNWSCMKANHIALLSAKPIVKNQLIVFPNPCFDGFYFPQDQIQELMMFSTDGKQIKNITWQDDLLQKGMVKVSTRGLLSGIYWIKSGGNHAKIMVLNP